jgi:hypothetical protein
VLGRVDASFIEKTTVAAVVATDAGCLRRRGSRGRAPHLAEALAAE